MAKILFLVFLCAIYVSDDLVDFEAQFESDMIVMIARLIQTIAIIIMAVYILKR